MKLGWPIYVGHARCSTLQKTSLRNKIRFTFYHRFGALLQTESTTPYRVNVFYVVAEEKKQSLWFPVNQYYSRAVDFDLEQVSENLRDLGFVPTGKHRDFDIYLKDHNDQKFFDDLYELIERISQELEATLP